MGKILPIYKKALIDEVIDNITGNTSHYYAFASNPIEDTGTVPAVTDDDYSKFNINWKMLFGKKIANNDIAPVIQKNIWTSNTIYDMYNNISTTLYSNNNYYVISEPITPGGSYHIYKCIDNANGSPSTVDPSSIGTPTQVSTFETADDYKWRYITSISDANYVKFSTDDYAPIYPNSSIVATAPDYSGVDVVMISNSGSGYDSYSNGIVRGVVNSTLIQIENDSSSSNFYYNNSGIYIYNTIAATSQLRVVNNYISNTSGKWIYLNEAANTDNITPSVTEYLITPQVKFTSDGDSHPKAYSTINSTSNSIHRIVMLDSGSNISWCNVSIISSFGSGANVYAIVPPAGGHGYEPVSELNVKGYCVSFEFANTEGSTIFASNNVYNKIGLLKNPYILETDGTKGSRFSSNTFSQLFEANVSPGYTFTNNQVIIGANSGARGIVVFSNTSQLYFVGDKNFIDGEPITNSSSSANLTSITINTRGGIYTKDLKPIYIQNINNINRSNTQTESFKLVIKV